MSRNNLKRQKGIVLLGFVIFIIMGVLAYYLNTFSVVEIRQQQKKVTTKALQQAKQALIAYALVYGDVDGNSDTFIDFPGEYGFLPCPDIGYAGFFEGIEDSAACGTFMSPQIGFFPWKTLDIPTLKDDSNTCLLYAVSGEYKNIEAALVEKTAMLNEDTNGMFQIVNQAGVVIQGAAPEDRVVAIIFAPGKVISGKSRNNVAGSFCGEDYGNYDAYLDVGGTPIIVADNSDVSAGADTIDQFIHARSQSNADTNPNPYNDRFVTITREEIWFAIRKRSDFTRKMTDLTEALALCLENYAADALNTNNQLPWPSPMMLTNYRINANYDDNVDETSGYAGRFPFIIDHSKVLTGNTGSDELFINASCNNLSVTSGANVDLQTPGSEYRRLWENWKDHFFYVVSKDYAPDSSVSLASCGTCIEVDDTERSAMIVFGGTRQGNQTRREPIAALDVDTKFEIDNYMENGNEAVFLIGNGNGKYYTNTANEISYCLSHASPPTAVTC
ncbi:hypothetical protein MNBD_GAMMA05-1845 [hydrothermal vent metagenome]|uniref:Uncharacterized protein n=1 Tax=hydrothermal vent metagenome TaxID=652676 RepID=A0A3B0WFU8_9ZZZZ